VTAGRAPLRPLPRVACLTNPNSGRNRRQLNAVRALLRRHPEVLHREVLGQAEVSAALAGMASDPPAVLAVNSGDGTVQAVLTALLLERPFPELPRLVLLRGGTTNMTAGDVGPGDRLLTALHRLLDPARDLEAEVVERPVLRVDVTPEGPTRMGMFFGTGAIVRGIEFCHRNVHSRGLRDGLAPGLCTLRVLWAMVRGDARYAAGRPMTVKGRVGAAPAGGVEGEQDYLLVLASALERLFLGLHPYWGDTRGALHFSSLRARPGHALRTLPPLFWGRAGRHATPEQGYFSATVDELSLEMDGPLTLDGEIYQASRARGPVRVSVGGRVSFLRF
jgi:hypothetical protein